MAVYLGLFWPFFHLLYVFKEVEKKGWDFAQVYENHQTKEDLQLESQLPKRVINMRKSNNPSLILARMLQCPN